MTVHLRLADPDFLAAVVVARDARVASAPDELAARLDALVARRAAETFPPPHLKDAVRAMLRRGGFKPAGRNKPANEYLAQAARDARFPRINNLVDVNNLLSLESGLPISLLDRAPFGGDAIEIRYGRPGETYVFNAANQEIDLAGLVCTCRPDGPPLGNPIKDSMDGKLKPHTRDVVGVIYGTRSALDESQMQSLATEFADLLKKYGGATETHAQIVSA
jgi:DNA/RNA-binding domain of Phe-tRNA-synthetase-like protein